ncbi:MAG: AzlD domain-containing protein [Rhodobacteraceae bacterium]|nr:AzlD domain-containing protein [Paracoccaceae bacterium]
MTQSNAEIWFIIVAMGIGTFLVRFSFLGMIGERKMPPWVLRHLRYTPVAVLPALVAPMVVWPQATGGSFDLPRVLAAAATLGIGYWTKNVLAAIGAGAGTLYAMLYLLG